MNQPTAYVLSCGDELLFGHTVDTNAAWLARECTGLGWRILGHRTVGDVTRDIAEAFREASSRADVVILTGGLGPTNDDRTRQALAEALGVELYEDPRALSEVEDVFRRFNRPMSAVNRVQALIPRGTTRIFNPDGTAPGIRAALGNAVIYVLPGVPREMRGMFNGTVKPELEKTHGGRREALRRLRLFGKGESDVGEAIRHLMGERDNPEVGTTVADGIITVRIYAKGDTLDQALAIADAAEAGIREALGGEVFGVEDETLASTVVEALKKSGGILCVAESCTGGMIAGQIVDVPGASTVFMEGTVAYSDAAKIHRLGVDPSGIERHGAVSRETAIGMARGALERASVKTLPAYSLAVTGIAGPDGGAPEKPVGTVWIACGAIDRDGGGTMRSRLYNTVADRYGTRLRATHAALDLLRRILVGLPLDPGTEETPWRPGE
ncbi:MAG: competence/damage-inducible protein A [Planctomycetota bacterium]|nr:competence/damage-inducible protein A [Planctomycetota bacterium]